MAQNVNKSPIANLIASSVTANGATHDNPFWSGLQVGINITAMTGTAPTLTVFIEGQDDTSGVYYPLLSSAPLTTTGFTLLTLYPGVGVTANISASQVLPKTWRIRWAIGGTTPAITATIGASMKV